MNEQMRTIEEERRVNYIRAVNNHGQLSGTAMSAGRIMAHAATGGIGKILRVETERKLRGTIADTAEKAAAYYKSRAHGDDGGTEENQYMGVDSMGEGDVKTAKLQGVGFWIIFGIVCMNEIFGVLADFTFVLSFLAIISGLATAFIVYFYLALQGVSFSQRKMVLWLISILIEVIPFLNILPTFPITLLIFRYMETSEFLQNKMKLAGKMAKI